MNEKLCVFCQNCRISTDGYGIILCDKNHWPESSSIPERKVLLQAETCPDYKEASS